MMYVKKFILKRKIVFLTFLKWRQPKALVI